MWPVSRLVGGLKKTRWGGKRLVSCRVPATTGKGNGDGDRLRGVRIELLGCLQFRVGQGRWCWGGIGTDIRVAG